MRKRPPEAGDQRVRSPEPGLPSAAAKTKTLPESLRMASFEGDDSVTALQMYNTDMVFPLEREKATFTCGSAATCDVTIAGHYLSGLHCLLQRRGSGMRIHDQASHNGTHFGGAKVDVFDARPGDTFNASGARLLLLNDEMQRALTTLSEILGSADEGTLMWSSGRSSSPCDVIVAAKEGANILITGDTGCDQGRLAQTVHAISLRRKRELVQLDREPSDRAAQRAVIDRASRGTLVLNLAADAPVMDATFASMLFAPSYHIRVIAIAPTVKKARDVLGEMHTATLRTVSLPPIAHRLGAVPRLLDRMFAAREDTLRISDMSDVNQGALQSYSWPGNLAELRAAADWLIEIARQGNPNAAAEKLGVASSSLYHWYGHTLGMSTPLLANQEPRQRRPSRKPKE